MLAVGPDAGRASRGEAGWLGAAGAGVVLVHAEVAVRGALFAREAIVARGGDGGPVVKEWRRAALRDRDRLSGLLGAAALPPC